MGNLFAGLESLGLNIKDNVDVYEKEKKENQSAGVKKAQVKEIQEEDLLFDKTYTCPVCDHEFKSKMVRTGKAKLVSADTDLRPKYQGIDPLKYDAILCPKCGHASLNRYFNFVMSSQAKMIREKISATYHYVPEGEKVYTYDEAITRHKMALLNTIVKHGKTSERAYTCLKIAWLFRGKREELMKGDYKKEEAVVMRCFQNLDNGERIFEKCTRRICGSIFQRRFPNVRYGRIHCDVYGGRTGTQDRKQRRGKTLDIQSACGQRCKPPY